eukprot:6086050-Amphidinium_carterae.1
MTKAAAIVSNFVGQFTRVGRVRRCGMEAVGSSRRTLQNAQNLDVPSFEQWSISQLADFLISLSMHAAGPRPRLQTSRGAHLMRSLLELLGAPGRSDAKCFYISFAHLSSAAAQTLICKRTHAPKKGSQREEGMVIPSVL